MITVKELIKMLEKLDPTLRVVTPGFDEGGVDDIRPPKIVKLEIGGGVGGLGGGLHELWDDPDATSAVLIDF